MRDLNNYLAMFDLLLELNPSLDINTNELIACTEEVDKEDDNKSQLLNAVMAGYMFGVAVGATEATRKAVV